MSETKLCRARLAPYCTGCGLDVGFGGSSIAPHAINFDQHEPYTNVGADPQHLRGHCGELPFRKNTLDFIYSSHLIEDFKYDEQVDILHEWMRVLRRNGKIILYCPDEAIYSKHCADTGQDYNLAHKNRDYSLKTFKERVLARLPQPIKIIHESPLVEIYSWEIVFKGP